MNDAVLWFLIPAAVLAGLAVLWAVLAVLLTAPGRYPANDPARLLPKSSAPTPVAHRGLHDLQAGIPENSLPAFRAALDAGYAIELDINLTADGQVVVFHDDTLARVCGDERRVCDCTLAELRELTLFDTAERIPLFSEVLSLVNGRQTIIVELKMPPRKDLLCTEALAMLKAYGGPYCVECFHPGVLLWFRKNAPEVVRGQLAGPPQLYPKRWMGLLMSASLTNIMTRPHFSAFQYTAAPHRLTQRLYRLLGGKTAAWTLCSAEDYRLYSRYFDVMIFEGADTVPGSRPKEQTTDRAC